MKFYATKSWRAFSVVTMGLAGTLLMLPTEPVFAALKGNNSAQAHEGKNCGAQADEQKLAGDARDQFLQACKNHEATGNTGGQDPTTETPTSGSDTTPPTQTLSK